MRGVPAGVALAAGLLLGLLTACQPRPAGTPAPPPALTAHPPTATAGAQPTAPSGDAESHLALLPAFRDEAAALPEAARYAITVTLQEWSGDLLGESRIVYTNTETTPLEHLVLRLYPNLPGQDAGVELHNVQVNDRPTEPTLCSMGTAARLPLAAPLPPGQSATLTFDFVTRVPGENARGYGAFGVRDDTWTLAGFYPMVAVFDHAGWDEQVPAPYGDMTYSDVAFYQVTATLPAEYTVAATGTLVEKRCRLETCAWRSESGPVRDF
ncbi:MAG: M1 family metallopeptidase, partial [Chloroflexi bacterium]|nr:M1 family metallopeptidase [Chloroflexota bacterium]